MAAVADSFDMTWSVHFSDYVPRIAILVSTQAHCLYDLLDRQGMGELSGDVPVVISNRPDLEHVADSFGVHFRCFPVEPQAKAAQERQFLEELEEHRIGLVVFAR